MVLSLVKEDSLPSQHSLFACWECWLEELSFVEDKLCSFRA
uniref:Uncharacterized protein n=1 Tax=Lotus japonicus TaxID=34305 RepID=I3SP35_LOTJA|nr:unknown [Lotus japonicus]